MSIHQYPVPGPLVLHYGASPPHPPAQHRQVGSPAAIAFILVSTSAASNPINMPTYGKDGATQQGEPLFLKHKSSPKYQLIAQRALTEVY